MKMKAIGAVLLCLIVMSCDTLQQPTFFKNTFKGLHGVVSRPVAHTSPTVRAVYYHDQTVAIVDLGPKNELHDCNLIEVYEQAEALEVLSNLSMSMQPQKVNFDEMTKLMQKCELLDKLQMESLSTLSPNTLSKATRVGVNSLSLLSGILPGTKWCGTGDIAENYHDLGQDAQIDRCCRSHDLCPVKVRAQQTRYNLTNYSLYTKSHCTCDEGLYRCLKTTKHPTANIMGHIYFNILKVPCIEDMSNNFYPSVGITRQFISVKMSY